MKKGNLKPSYWIKFNLLHVHLYTSLTDSYSEVIIDVRRKLKCFTIVIADVLRICCIVAPDCSINPFPPRGSPLTSKIVWYLRQSKITMGTVLVSLGKKGLRKRDGQIPVGPVNPFPPRGSPLMSNIVWH